MAIDICKSSWNIPEIFRLIKDKANLDDKEMYRTFNMGIGMIIVLDGPDIDEAIGVLSAFGIKSHVIGEVVKGKGGIRLV
jgi:phosphoribosylformylglycinamidine cyclo-ligase